LEAGVGVSTRTSEARWAIEPAGTGTENTSRLALAAEP
jgi:hypothetical protein